MCTCSLSKVLQILSISWCADRILGSPSRGPNCSNRTLVHPPPTKKRLRLCALELFSYMQPSHSKHLHASANSSPHAHQFFSVNASSCYSDTFQLYKYSLILFFFVQEHTMSCQMYVNGPPAHSLAEPGGK